MMPDVIQPQLLPHHASACDAPAGRLTGRLTGLDARIDDPLAPPGGPQDPSGPGGPSTGTAVLERTELSEQLDDGDHDRFAHYVRKAKIAESAVTGKPVIALCGKVWVPGRDPSKYPVCPMCKEVYEGLRSPNDGGDGDKGGNNGSSQ